MQAFFLLPQRRVGPREKLITFLLIGRMIFCNHVNRFLIVSLLLKYLPNKTLIFKVNIVPKNAIFGANFPPRCPVQVFSNKCHSE